MSFANGAKDGQHYNAVFVKRRPGHSIWIDVMSFGSIQTDAEIIVDYGKCFCTGNFAQGELASDHSSQAVVSDIAQRERSDHAQDAGSLCAAQEPAAVHPFVPTVPGLLTANDSQYVVPSTHSCAVLDARMSTRGRLAEKANLGTSGTSDGRSGSSGNSEQEKGSTHDPQKPNNPQITWYSAFLAGAMQFTPP